MVVRLILLRSLLVVTLAVGRPISSITHIAVRPISSNTLIAIRPIVSILIIVGLQVILTASTRATIVIRVGRPITTSTIGRGSTVFSVPLLLILLYYYC